MPGIGVPSWHNTWKLIRLAVTALPTDVSPCNIRAFLPQYTLLETSFTSRSHWNAVNRHGLAPCLFAWHLKVSRRRCGWILPHVCLRRDPWRDHGLLLRDPTLVGNWRLTIQLLRARSPVKNFAIGDWRHLRTCYELVENSTAARISVTSVSGWIAIKWFKASYRITKLPSFRILSTSHH